MYFGNFPKPTFEQPFATSFFSGDFWPCGSRGTSQRKVKNHSNRCSGFTILVSNRVIRFCSDSNSLAGRDLESLRTGGLGQLVLN